MIKVTIDCPVIDILNEKHVFAEFMEEVMFNELIDKHDSNQVKVIIKSQDFTISVINTFGLFVSHIEVNKYSSSDFISSLMQVKCCLDFIMAYFTNKDSNFSKEFHVTIYILVDFNHHFYEHFPDSQLFFDDFYCILLPFPLLTK